MRQKFAIIWAVLAFIFIISAVIASLKPDADELPFSSYSASAGGTKAAYLLLSELGFNVVRKTVSNDEWGADGLIIALGADYLAESGQDLVIANSERFTNRQIRLYANDFIVLLFPYKDHTIVFDEYGRRRYPLQTADGFTDGRPSSVWGIMPTYLRLLFLYCCFLALCIMFFYKQRVGEAIVLEGFSGRNTMEGVNAMANAMRKARVFKDSAEFYYKYQAGKYYDWDKDGRLRNAVDSVKTEREALHIISEIDKNLKIGMKG